MCRIPYLDLILYRKDSGMPHTKVDAYWTVWKCQVRYLTAKVVDACFPRKWQVERPAVQI
jgi:hypothetical protein